eukprot:TRINITY_DN7153_c0_g1_i3.p1 TRINITY_DN7153_c0_g1~~TRINITY_DN7153_c0_g1_i3.p1  ORF type:complete len:222 (+),score=19.33 TRINITY_DN7153_c0_g1_i3:45-668(+)
MGGYQALKRFVQAANQLGIAVILDVVWNHMSGNNILENYDGNGGSSGNGIYFYQGQFANTPWGPRPNYDNSAVFQYITDNIQMWLSEYHISGFRWDSTICIRSGGDPCWSDIVDIPNGWKLMQQSNILSAGSQYKAWSTAEDNSEYWDITKATTDTSAGLPGAPGGAGFNDQWAERYYDTAEPALVLEIGRAVQQECRDRSRMPSSA